MTKQSQLILLCLVLGVHSIVLIGYRQPIPRQPAETEARKDSPVIMLTERQQTLELTSHAMVRDPKLLVRVHEHGYTGPVWKSTFPTINPHSTEPEDTSNLAVPKSVWGRPLFDWTRQYSKSIAPLPALPRATSNSNRNIPTSIPSSTQMFFSDSIESRKPTIKEDPPRWRGTELLPPIQLEIGISAKGTVEAVRWTGHSRHESLFSTFHQEVIQFIKRLQFTPLKQVEFDKAPPWTWGTIDFIWGHPEAPGISSEEIQPALSPQP